MRRRCGSIGALAVLLLVCSSSSLHRAAGARLLPAAAVVPPLAHRQDKDGAMAAATDMTLVLRNGAEANGGDLSVSASEMMGAEEEDAVACEERSADDECIQRRLLRDAHLDYIYTQHKGKP